MRPHAHVPPSAILLIVASVLCFTLLDATVKLLTERYPVPLLVWARYAMQMLIMLLWLAPQMGVSLLRTRRLRLHLARAVLLPLSSLCFFSALKFLPLAETTAINYTTPVLVIVLAVVFLDERMTRHRIALVLACIGGHAADRPARFPGIPWGGVPGAGFRRVLRDVPDPDPHARR